jgi:hypothetical protein
MVINKVGIMFMGHFNQSRIYLYLGDAPDSTNLSVEMPMNQETVRALMRAASVDVGDEEVFIHEELHNKTIKVVFDEHDKCLMLGSIYDSKHDFEPYKYISEC